MNNGITTVFSAGSIDFSSMNSIGEFKRFFNAYNDIEGVDNKVDLLVQTINEARECVARSYCYNCMAFSMLYTLLKDKCTMKISMANLVRDKEVTHEELSEHQEILDYFRQNIGRNYKSAQKAIKVGDLLLKWINDPNYGGQDKKFDASHMNMSTYNAVANIKGVDDRLALLDKIVNGEEDSVKLVQHYNGAQPKVLSEEEKKMRIDDKRDELKVLVRKVNEYIKEHILIYYDENEVEWTGGKIKIYKGV